VSLSARTHQLLVGTQYGLAAGVACAVSGYLVPADRLSATFVALMCVQPSWLTSARQGLEQLTASALGAVTTLMVLLVLPNHAVAVGVGVTLTYLIADRLRYGPSAMVVALFSALYMTILAQKTVWGTLLLRAESVALGVLVGITVNVVFLNWVRRPYLTQARAKSLVIVERCLIEVRQVVRLENVHGLQDAAGAIRGGLTDLDALHQALLDARRDPDPGATSVRPLAINALLSVRANQNALRHLLDIVNAASALTSLGDHEASDASGLWTRLDESLAAGSAVVTALKAGLPEDATRRLALEQTQLKAFDLALIPPGVLSERLGPRIALLVALMQFHSALASQTGNVQDDDLQETHAEDQRLTNR